MIEDKIHICKNKTPETMPEVIKNNSIEFLPQERLDNIEFCPFCGEYIGIIKKEKENYIFPVKFRVNIEWLGKMVGLSGKELGEWVEEKKNIIYKYINNEVTGVDEYPEYISYVHFRIDTELEMECPKCSDIMKLDKHRIVYKCVDCGFLIKKELDT